MEYSFSNLRINEKTRIKKYIYNVKKNGTKRKGKALGKFFLLFVFFFLFYIYKRRNKS